eukprot:gene5015-6244_t
MDADAIKERIYQLSNLINTHKQQQQPQPPQLQQKIYAPPPSSLQHKKPFTQVYQQQQPQQYNRFNNPPQPQKPITNNALKRFPSTTPLNVQKQAPLPTTKFSNSTYIRPQLQTQTLNNKPTTASIASVSPQQLQLQQTPLSLIPKPQLISNAASSSSTIIKQPQQQITKPPIQPKASLINKTIKTNTKKQYCLFFNRLGKCNDGSKCKYIHDMERVRTCPKFLQDKCDDPKCTLKHKITDIEQMPVCYQFLKGNCTHENCPYLHVFVSKDAKVCPEFLKGYCPNGSSCKLKHTYSFDKKKEKQEEKQESDKKGKEDDDDDGDMPITKQQKKYKKYNDEFDEEYCLEDSIKNATMVHSFMINPDLIFSDSDNDDNHVVFEDTNFQNNNSLQNSDTSDNDIQTYENNDEDEDEDDEENQEL